MSLSHPRGHYKCEFGCSPLCQESTRERGRDRVTGTGLALAIPTEDDPQEGHRERRIADVILCKDGYSAALLAHVTTTYDE